MSKLSAKVDRDKANLDDLSFSMKDALTKLEEAKKNLIKKEVAVIIKSVAFFFKESASRLEHVSNSHSKSSSMCL
jgi:hypothetical protein